MSVVLASFMVQAESVPAALSADAPGTVFLAGEVLRFRPAGKASASPRWILRDWRGEVLRSGEWEKGKSELELEALPCGYYCLEPAKDDGTPLAGARSFAIVPVPNPNPNGFFAVDSAQSSLARPNKSNPYQPANAFELVSEVARRSGVPMVRERLRWRDVESSPGKYDWKQYALNADLLATRGVAVSGMYHDAPKWVNTNTEKLPGDLFALYQFNKKLAEQFKGKMKVWEFWNEQDHHYSTESAWDYASALKAAYLGFKAGDPDLPVALGGIAITSLKPYNYVMMESGAGGYFDIFNVHTYQPLRDYPGLLRNIHAFREKFSLTDRPIWFTESGSQAEGSGREDGPVKGFKAHSSEQELIVAEYIPKMMVYLQSLGVDRDFAFVLPPYNEQKGAKDWGLMRRDFSVKPGYVALANLTAGLGHAALEGEITVGDGIRAFLYRQADGSQSLAYFSISEIDVETNQPDRHFSDLGKRSFPLAVPGKSYRGADIFGTPFILEAEHGKLVVPATRMIARLDGLSGLKPDLPFRAKRTAMAAPSVDFDRSIVYRVELSDDFELTAERDCAAVRKEKAAFKLQIFNFSDTALTGKLAISGGQTEGLPDAIRLPAFDKVELPLVFVPEWDSEFHTKLRIDGEFNGRQTSPLVAPLFNFQRFVATGRQELLPGSSDPGNWRKNTSGKMEIKYDSAEAAVRFDVNFPPGVDCWVYPEYNLQLPQESLRGSFGLVFEIKVSEPEKIRQMLVMGVEGPVKISGKPYYLPVKKPSANWEERVVRFDHPGLDPAKLKALRFGFNLNTDRMTYLIRNVRILYPGSLYTKSQTGDFSK